MPDTHECEMFFSISTSLDKRRVSLSCLRHSRLQQVEHHAARHGFVFARRVQLERHAEIPWIHMEGLAVDVDLVGLAARQQAQAERAQRAAVLEHGAQHRREHRTDAAEESG